jgi:hypothetical protein
MSTSEEDGFSPEFYASDLVAETEELLRRLQDEEPLNALRMLGIIRVQVRRVESALVEELRMIDYSWADIGAATGLSRQGAAQRYSELE